MLFPRALCRRRRSCGKLQLLWTVLLLTVVINWFCRRSHFNHTTSKDNEKNEAYAEGGEAVNSNLNGNLENTNGKQLAKKVGYDKKTISERFKERSSLVKTVCETHGLRKRPLDLPKFMYIRDKNVLFCPIQKSASTFWQRVLYTFARHSDKNNPFSVNIDTAYKDSGQHKISKTENVEQIIQNAKSFIFVRHPFTRLFSGWLDKFYSTHPGFWSYGLQMINIERRQRQTRRSCGHDVTFQEFISFVSGRLLSGRSYIDHHFTPCYTHCDVCYSHFKYIGKYETFKEDTQFIMDEYGMTNNSTLFDNFEDKSELDMIDDAVDWVFGQKGGITRCISFQCGLFRVWKRLTCRGVISKKEQFPYKTADQVVKLTKDQFRKDLIAAHKRSDPAEVARNREEVLAEAFQSLEKETFDQMLDAFKLDFELFGYSRHEPYLDLKVSNNPDEKYLQQCPFQ